MKSESVFPSKYLKAEELDDELTVTIKKVVMEEMESKDGRSQDKPVAYFKEINKGLVVNKTNWSIIAKQHGDESDDWVGKQITLFVMDVEAFGEMVNAIRVRPATKPRKGLASKAETEPEADKDAIQTFWRTAKGYGLNQKQGLAILDQNGGDFGEATKFLEADNAMPE